MQYRKVRITDLKSSLRVTVKNAYCLDYLYFTSGYVWLSEVKTQPYSLTKHKDTGKKFSNGRSYQ